MQTSLVSILKRSSDFGAFPRAGFGVVALVVGFGDVNLVQSMKMQGSKRSLGTPPKTKAELEIRSSAIFMMRYQNKIKKLVFRGSYILL